MYGTATGRRCSAISRVVAVVLALGALMASSACAPLGIVDDGSSVSWGPSNRGKLLNPAAVPRRGDGFEIPPLWWQRGLRWGTDEMVDLIAFLGREVSRAAPGSVVGIGDVSLRRGGPSAWHRSHQTGRDVDLVFFVRDGQGHPVREHAMRRFDGDGRLRGAGDLYFDVERNWLLVRALIANPVARVQFVFVYDPLKQLLLDHARAIGEPDYLIEMASYIMHQPGDSLPHDDHFHVRVYCDAYDLGMGCQDRGDWRWNRKGRKYALLTARLPAAVAGRLGAALPAMLALGALPL